MKSGFGDEALKCAYGRTVIIIPLHTSHEFFPLP